MSAFAARRRWLAPEVVQTSSMDCGPAALKCLLEGFGVEASYGRLREACQTDIDGTSIDVIEGVACQLGLQAEQVMTPVDHLLRLDDALPALVVVRHADLGTHFLVVWRRLGPWVQVMDPSLGRRWIRADRFLGEVYRHETAVEAADWRAWAATAEFLEPLARRLRELGLSATAACRLADEALADPEWFAIAALDASARLTAALVEAGGVKPGAEAARLVRALFRDTCGSDHHIFAVVPAKYWSVTPDAENADPTRQRLRLQGAVMLQVSGLGAPAGSADRGGEPLPPELSAALEERLLDPVSLLWRMTTDEGPAVPLALAGASVVATGALMLEAVLFRGLFELGAWLHTPMQRLAGLGLLLAFMAILLAVEAPVVFETLRQGRRLEVRFRMALLRKLPRLNDRYFSSRPISDMADRGHNIHLVRNLPGTALQLLQACSELILTLCGLALIAPDALVLALLVAVTAVAAPLLLQPLINERDLRVRNHAGALSGFYLDTLVGLAPIRAHRAERAVMRQHEGLMVDWARAAAESLRLSLLSGGAQTVVCSLLVGALVLNHFHATGTVAGADLLLVYWALKLPMISGRLAGLAQSYPAQRNAMLRLMEPLAAPEALGDERRAPDGWLGDPQGAVRIDIAGGEVVAGGHVILRDLNLTVQPGEHVAVVGLSGAGKSSLLALLLGWHRLAKGRLSIDGFEPGPSDLERLRAVTAWVDPAVQIWNRTLLENLAYASDDDGLDRVAQVLTAANLTGVAQVLPEGLQTPLGEGGAMLSGGEGQRLRLGRAMMARDPQLVLLDEPFRGLDREQRRSLLETARRWWRGVTLLCVTHDIGETAGFDRVLVVEGGLVVEDGAPRGLMARDSRYRQLMAAEDEVRRMLWRSSRWRRMTLAGGRLREGAA